jgi:RHS repeat-associated protein
MKHRRMRPVKRAIFRFVSLILVHTLILGSVPAAAKAEPASAAAAVQPAPALPAPAPPAVNRTRPAAPSLPRSPAFSIWPSEAEISAARVFEEPLVPAQATSRRENRRLAQALTRYLEASNREDLRPLEDFLEAHPASPWRVSIVTNLGLVAQQRGYFSKALGYHEEAWRLGKDAGEPRTRAIAERAVSELAWLLTGLGHDERLSALLREVEGRPFSGASDQRLQMARQGLWLMQNRPAEAFRCGPVALSNVLRALGIEKASEIAHHPGSRRGTSLAQMKALAATAGVDLPMARRVDPGAAFPTPAMVHLKTGHFAAVLERSGEGYRIADPVFREEQWISADALDAESSGYVLATAVPEGFAPVGDAEGAAVWGRSCPNPPDPTETCPSTGGNGCAASGFCPRMADYTFLSLHAALRIVDTPLTYRPPKGPSVDFTLTYNQKEVFQPAVFSYVNVGPKWTFDAISYVIDDPLATQPHTVKVYLRGGGMEIYPLLPVTGRSAPHFRTRAILERVNATTYVRRLPDGSSETFGKPDGAGSFPRKLFLTEEADAQQNKLSFVYSDSLQLAAIVDALGQVTTFSYPDEASGTITGMTDPFGRRAVLSYDSAGRLASITDSLGLTSSFTYATGDFITSMTTPYGTTHFTTGSQGLRTWVEAEDPLGARERAEYVITHDSTIGPRVLPSSEVPPGFAHTNGNFDAGLTLFWGKRAMALSPNDLSSAEITHWLENPATHRPRGIVRAHKKPLEGRVFYAYEGQNRSHGDDGRLLRVGRILTPAPQLTVQVTQYTRNLVGLVCTLIDPMGRETRYTYGTNNVADASCPGGSSIDLLKVEQKNGAGYDLVQTLTYNPQHLPLTVRDGAGQTTTYSYNAAGQIATVTTPPRAGFPGNEDRTTAYTYEALTGYLLRMVSPGTVTTAFTYDAYGRLRTMTNNDGDTTTYDYDLFDRPTRTTHPDATYEEIAYERLDAHRFRDRLGRWTESFYDPLRRLVSTRDPAGRVVRQEWCGCGSLDRLVDANGNATSWEYDIQGRVTQEIRANDSPEQPSLRHVYESTTSRVRSRIDAKGQETRYSYALDDRLTNTAYLNAQHPTPNVTLSYADPQSGVLDPHGRLRRLTDGTGNTTYHYHPFGQLGGGALSLVDGPYANDGIGYGYDELGRVVSRTFEGRPSTWVYDQQGRLQSQGDDIGTFIYTYPGNVERVETLTYPNKQTYTYTYHGSSQDRRLQEIRHLTPSIGDVFAFNYDDAGNIKSMARPEGQFALEYDRADQLRAVTQVPINPDPGQDKRYRYAYDPAGNRTAEQVQDAVQGATYNSRNQLTSQQPGGTILFAGTTNEPARVTVQAGPSTTTTGPSNQFAGNAQSGSGQTDVVVQATDFAPGANLRTNTYRVSQSGPSRTFTYDANGNLASRIEAGGSTATYDWDAENRLLAVRQGSTTLAAFTYDGLGRRASKTAGTQSVIYVWDGEEVLQERSANGNRRYIRGPGIDHHLAMVADPPGTPTYFVTDHLGSVVRTTNSAGDSTLVRQYDPWGNMLQGASTSGYAYTGREWDAETGLYYYRARYYDPRIGRFLGEDPIGVRGGLNLHAYTGNNPSSWTDPLGLMPSWQPKTKLVPCFTPDQRTHCEVQCASKGGVKTCNMLIVTKLKSQLTPDGDTTIKIWVEEAIWPPQCTCNREDDDDSFCKKNPGKCLLLVPVIVLGYIVMRCLAPMPVFQPAMAPPMAPGSNGGA